MFALQLNFAVSQTQISTWASYADAILTTIRSWVSSLDELVQSSPHAQYCHAGLFKMHEGSRFIGDRHKSSCCSKQFLEEPKGTYDRYV